MDITIKKIGSTVGTVGWLAKGLRDGDIVVYEGIQKDNGFHGLWMKGKDIEKPMFIAGYNQFDLSVSEYERADRYEVADEHFTPQRYSAACWRSIRSIAQSWCDECNELINNEEPVSVKTVRVDEVAA